MRKGRGSISAALTLAGLLAGGAVRGESHETLVRTEQLRELVRSDRASGWNFQLEGLVTAVLQGGQFVLEDATGRFRLFNCRPPLPQVGDIVRASGYIANMHSRRDELRIADGVTVEPIGRTDAVPVLDVPLSRLSEPDMDMRTVRVEGTVVSVMSDETDPHWELLAVRDGNGTVIVAFRPPDGALSVPHAALVNARVSVTGVCFRNVSGLRCCIGPYVEICAADDVRVLTPPPVDPFAAPPLETFGVHSAAEIAAMGRRSLVGTVAATWLPDCACVLEDDRNPVRVSFAEGVDLPAVGGRIRVIGHPGTDLYAINLGNARWRAESGEPLAEPPAEGVEAARLFLADDTERIDRRMRLAGKILEVTGRIAAGPGDLMMPGRYRLVGDTGAILVDASTHPEAGARLETGCRVRVKGVCFYETEAWGPGTVLPCLRHRLLVLRSPRDVVVVDNPPWRTVRRLLIVICLLVTFIGLLLVRSRLARRRARLRLEDRTRLAVELHDSLSQNLAAAAFEIAAARGARRDGRDVAERHLDTAERMLGSSRTQLRQCLWDLRSDTLEDPDFARAVRNTVRLVAGAAEVRVRVGVARSLMDDTCAHAVLSILRELVSNAVSHGGASLVSVAGARTDDGAIAFSVTDDGIGFDAATAPGARQGHFGLVGIRDRVRGLGGTFDIAARPKGGTRAVIRIKPVKPRTRKP